MPAPFQFLHCFCAWHFLPMVSLSTQRSSDILMVGALWGDQVPGNTGFTLQCEPKLTFLKTMLWTMSSSLACQRLFAHFLWMVNFSSIGISTSHVWKTVCCWDCRPQLVLWTQKPLIPRRVLNLSERFQFYTKSVFHFLLAGFFKLFTDEKNSVCIEPFNPFWLEVWYFHF